VGEVVVHDAVAEAGPQQPRLDLGVVRAVETFDAVDTPPSVDPLGQFECGLIVVGLRPAEGNYRVESEVLQRAEQ